MTVTPKQLKNLIPIKDKAKARELGLKGGSKGGSVRSLKKKYGQKLRWMREKGMKTKDIDWFLQRISDPEADMIEIYRMLNALKETILDANKNHGMPMTAEFRLLAKAMIDAHKAHFGDKKKIEGNVNVPIQINVIMPKDLKDLNITTKIPHKVVEG